VAAATALSFLAQATGAASLPAAMLPGAGAFPPPAARFGAFPTAPRAPLAAPAKKAAAPSNPSWLDSMKIVADFALARLDEEFAPAPAVDPFPALAAERAAGRDPEEFRAIAAPDAAPSEADSSVITPLAPGLNSPADRMMVVMEPGRHVEAVIDNNFVQPALPPQVAIESLLRQTLPPFLEPVVEGGGLRAQLAYVGSHGLLSGTQDGFIFRFRNYQSQLVSEAVPKSCRRDFPVYFSAEEIELSMTVENKTGRTLTGVTLEAIQETFRPSGTEGARILPPLAVPVAKTLAPGQKVTVHWRTKLMGPADKPVNLEQTHVKISADGLAAPLLDAPQAGVADPPGPGVL
jgi:hypothetical protein